MVPGDKLIDDLLGAATGLVSKAGDLDTAKNDVFLLRDEAADIKREVEEVRALAESLLQRQARVAGAVGRLKDVAGLGGQRTGDVVADAVAAAIAEAAANEDGEA